jgi:hypothetical protein
VTSFGDRGTFLQQGKDRENMAQDTDSEVDRNYDAFVALLPTLAPEFAGKHALLHAGEIVDYYDTALSATLAGMREFGDGHYSVQEVSAQPEHLGFYSYVGGAGPC